MSSNAIAVVMSSQDALMARNVDNYMNFLAEDVVTTDPVTPPVVGRENVRSHIEGLFGSLNRIGFVDRQYYAAGRTVTMKFTIQIETKAGRTGVFEGIDVFALNEQDQIRQITSCYDPADVARIFGS